MTDARDIEISRLAANQYGAFHRRQAFELGFTRRMIQRRLESGAWHTLHPAVYALTGTTADWLRAQMAACLWSHGLAAGKAAGRLFELPGCENAEVEVLTTSRSLVPHSGVIVDQTKRLPDEQIRTVRAIPTTSVERTLMMLCVRMRPSECRIAVDNALFRGLTTVAALDYCLFRTCRQGRGGSTLLREIVRERASIDGVPNSPLETLVLQALLDAELPVPKLQHEIRDDHGNFVARPDFVYPGQKVVIEAHSKLWHGGVSSHLRDAQRHRSMESLGFEIVYATFSDATRYRRQFGALVEDLLVSRGWTRP
ncbi:MAG TPA: type IV toxin-antitoxin system AbiEi family antitoxin domain-containing protein [Actinomycetota bacterium]|nr:type IV toxin-antitoxin system AbiEi family antitoxin domain-containing protein [Actinomycetota bacterium]